MYEKYDRAENLPLSHSDKKCERIFGRIRYLVMLKSNMSEVYSHKDNNQSKLFQMMIPWRN